MIPACILALLDLSPGKRLPMHNTTADSRPVLRRSALRGAPFFATSMAILLLSIGALAGCRAGTAGEATATKPTGEGISAGDLEERYGVSVRLLAVTAGGGIVDLRLKILDAEKGALLLGDPPKPPTLIVEETGAVLQIPQESISEDLGLRQGEVLILLYPNAQGAVKSGTQVTIVFENERLEPIEAQ
ncbi:MAG: hypothetical protein OEV76_10585 [Anaerolineae bacterium]|nr:hypothetical protein [Anaerolineae bacterium]